MAKLTLKQVKQIVREEFSRGVPEFVVKKATENYIEELKQHMMRFVLSDKSKTNEQRRQAVGVVNEVLDELEKEVNSTTQDRLFQFLRNV